MQRRAVLNSGQESLFGITSVQENLDAALEPLLLQQKFKQGGTEMIKVRAQFMTSPFA